MPEIPLDERRRSRSSLGVRIRYAAPLRCPAEPREPLNQRSVSARTRSALRDSHSRLAKVYRGHVPVSSAAGVNNP